MGLNIILNIFIIILVVTVLFLLIFKNNTLNLFESFNGSGYGFRKEFSENTTFIPLNNITKSTDFNLLSFINQLKSQIIKDNSNYDITKTEQGIISKTSQDYPNIIIFPGMSDVKIKENGVEIWPNGKSDKLNEIFDNNNNYYYEFDTNSNGHLNELYSLFKNLGYKHMNNLTLQLRENQYKYDNRTNETKLNTINYDFINLDMDLIEKQFISLLENYTQNKNKKTIIIGYDTGCILANLCILNLKTKNPELFEIINKFIMISPNFGGSVLSIKDLLNAYKNNDKYKFLSDGLLLNLPLENFYDKPVFILNSVGYKANNVSELFKLMNLTENLNEIIKKFNNMNDLHKKSLKDSGVDTHILFSEEVEIYKNQTPISYNYKNNLMGNPERYYLPNNNKTGSYETISNENGTIEGLTENGDNIIPTSSINILKQIFKNAIINKIKNKNHFTILKSYELALNISSFII